MEPLDKAGIGRRIRSLRRELGLRQWQLARLLGATQPAIHKYERGTLPEPGRLLELARLGRTSVEWILTGRHAEGGSEQRERPEAELFRLAERLRALGPEKVRAIESSIPTHDPSPAGSQAPPAGSWPGADALRPLTLPPPPPLAIQAAGAGPGAATRVEDMHGPGVSPEGLETIRRV